MSKEANLVEAYRRSRRDFIALCRKAGADTIARVHPAPGPDGKPLFCDSAAFGPRDAKRGVLLLGEDAPRVWLIAGAVLPPETRLVVVHALDPFARAWGKAGNPPDWPQNTLKAIAGEDLSRVRTLTVLGGSARSLKPALSAALPHVPLVFQRPATDAAILAAIAGL
ncbi:MAG TPA: DUF2817 domain-containing protein [Rhizomicrobium sp.]|nr:DUF2817 domain-containing protein [Rhizomicrobium sp.]